MARTPRKNPEVVAAEKLLKQLRGGFLIAEQAIINMIRSRAWEKLKYESFSKMWVEEMADITIALEIRPHVVYQLIEEGLDSALIADAVKGITSSGVDNLRRQKANGVPPGLATTRSPRKRSPLPFVKMSVHVPREHMSDWRRKARATGMTVEEFVYFAALREFNQIK